MYPLSIRNCASTLTKFIGSMAAVNEARGVEKRVVLRDDYDQEDLEATRITYENICAGHSVLCSTLRQAMGSRNLLRIEVVGYVNEFKIRVRGFKYHPVFAAAGKALRTDIIPTSSLELIAETAAVMIQEWQKINAVIAPDIPHPFLLRNGVTLEQFATTHAALQASGVAVILAQRAVSDSAAMRRQLIQGTIRPRLVEYRQMIKALYPANHVFVDNLPLVNPPPGSTPDTVSLRGGWDQTGQHVVLNWTAYQHHALESYEIRFCPDPIYQADEDEVVARLSPEVQSYVTAHGLPHEGDSASFRVYAITKSGRERGSNALPVIRPLVLQAAV